MNTEYTTPGQGKSFIPLTLISLSIIIFFASELSIISKDREAISTSKQKWEDIQNNSGAQLDPGVEKSKQAEAVVQKLVLDLLDLANKGNNDGAKQVITKYGIKQAANGAATTPAP